MFRCLLAFIQATVCISFLLNVQLQGSFCRSLQLSGWFEKESRLQRPHRCLGSSPRYPSRVTLSSVAGFYLFSSENTEYRNNNVFQFLPVLVFLLLENTELNIRLVLITSNIFFFFQIYVLRFNDYLWAL